MQLSYDKAPRASGAPRLPSFLIGGFEGADHRNSSGRPVAMLDATGHATAYARNYALLGALGIRAVRESIGWSRAERDGRFDFSCALRRAEAARNAGLTIIWTLWHYGLPDGLGIFDAALVDRFAAFAHAAACALRDDAEGHPIFCPVNEISFLAWAVCESPFIHPHRGFPGPASSAQGFALKQRLVRAALAGCDAIRAAIPGARMLHVDPLIHIVPPAGDPSRAPEAAHARTFQFQAWDMLAGRLAPELGGAPRYLDYVGVNYYHGNQFEIGTERRLHWHLRDPRRLPFRALLHEVYTRYARPVMISETSHFGSGRERWLTEIARDVRRAMREGVPVAGLCLYPITDRPDWEHPAHWHRSGLCDRVLGHDGTVRERMYLPYLRAVRHVQAMFGDDARANIAGTGSPDYAIVVLASCGLGSMPLPRRAAIEALAGHCKVLVVDAGTDDVDDAGTAAIVEHALEALQASGVREYGVWLHTPMALPAVMHLAPDLVAYTPDESVAVAERTDARFVQRDAALRRIAGVVGDLSPHTLDATRRSRWHAAARATLDHPAAGTRAGADARVRKRGSSNDTHESAECVIIGAGVAGLGAAYRYGAGSLLLEREVTPGGSRRSVSDHGFLFDLAGHVLDSRDEFDDLYRRVLGDNVEWRKARVRIANRGSAVPAPFLAAFASAAEPLGYPLHDGTQALIDGFLPLLDGAFLRGADVVRILPLERVVVLDDLRRIRYERLIVTLPLPALIALCEDAAPRQVIDAVSRLRTLSLRCVNVGARGVAPSDCDWLLDLGGDAIFDRVFMQGNVSPTANRPDGYAFACEIVHAPSRPLALHGAALVQRCLDDCVRAGLIASRDAVLVTHEIDLPAACVIDEDPQSVNVRMAERWLDAHGIAFTGSRGAWEPGRCGALLASAMRAADSARHALAAARTCSAAR